MCLTRMWRNWYTRTLEGRVASALRVRVSPSASNKRCKSPLDRTLFRIYKCNYDRNKDQNSSNSIQITLINSNCDILIDDRNNVNNYQD